MELGHEVVIAADKRPLELLKKEFPSLDFVIFPGYEISYPKKGNMVLKMLLAVPKIILGIVREHSLLKKIIHKKNIDILISDNRFGLWNKEIPCVFITHQLMVKSPLGEKLLRKLNYFFIRKYKECWIPDNEGSDNLSGDLSHLHPIPSNAFYIGSLSRFSTTEINASANNNYSHHLMIILSGPEPQRTVFENEILSQLKDTSFKTLVVRGIPEKEERRSISENIEMVSHLSTQEMKEAILSSELIISRSGYSSIMDYAVLGKRVIFVPTPGQTEQEYLADYFSQKGIAFHSSQHEFDLKKALEESKRFSGFTPQKKRNDFKDRVVYLLAEGG